MIGNPMYLGLEIRIGAPPGDPRQLQTVIPPSIMTNGAARRWNEHAEILPPPASLFADLDAHYAAEAPAVAAIPATPPATAEVTAGASSRPGVEDRARKYLEMCEPAVSGQGGHDKTFKVACSVGPGFDLPPDVAFALMRNAYNPRCEPPWSESELRHKVDESYRKEQKRGWLIEAPVPKPSTRPTPETPALRIHQGVTDRPADDADPTASGARPGLRFANYRESENDAGEPVKVAIRVAELDASLRGLVGDWPKCVRGDTLFWESPEYEPVYLRSSSQLFAWIDRRAHVDWTKGASYIPQERFYEHRRMTSQRFDGIETLPHWPPLPGLYYMHPPVPKAEGRLGELVDFFSPLTDEDRELIVAFVLTLFWGGSPGSRPAFLFTGPDQDEQQGRGIGKTKVAQILASEMAGGVIDVSPRDEISAVKTRLLSEGGSTARVAMLDNIKTLRLSSAELEGIITTSHISGHALYVGERKRPNTLIWVLTLNGVSLSKDMAQRVVCVKLTRPVHRPGWEDDVRSFIRTHRPAILAEIRDTLLSEPGPLRPKTRWSVWEAGVLSKLPRAEGCQRLFMERQESIDDDNEDRDIVADCFRSQILRCDKDPIDHKLFITSATAARWVNRATNKNMETNQASKYLKGLGIPELRKGKSDGIVGWVWCGPECNREANADRITDPEIEKPSGPRSTFGGF